ncbi:MAG: redoxin domain-containing protein [bacterium]
MAAFPYLLRITCLLSASAALALSPDNRVENFRLLDHQGGSQELYYFADAPALVLMTHSANCTPAESELNQFNTLQAEYATTGVEFMLINSVDPRERIRTHAQKVSLNAPVLMDSTQIIGESMQLETAGEFLVLNPDNWSLVYRGHAAGATEALNQLVSGQTVATPQTPAKGCDIEYPALARRDSHANISYSDTIAPILMDNCVSCHREGGIGPWAMTDYNMVRGFSLMIREVIRTGRMPPWHADPHYGEFANDRSLTTEEIQTLVHWIEAGAPRGDGADPLVEMDHNYPTWALGEPDLIIEIPAEEVPATGVVDYKYKMVDNPLSKDVWVRATELIPGDRSVLHHVITRFGTLETQGPRAGRLSRRGGGSLGGYVPGAVARDYPDGTGTLLPADATIEFQMHYTPTGKPATDTSRLGIYLHDTPPRHVMQGTVFINPRIRIPAGADNHSETSERVIAEDVILYSMLPHAHYRGKASEFVAHYPDGQVEKLISVPRYDFNWQTNYDLKEPKFIPAGTRVVHRTWWDNSARNTANPDPTRDVPWGQQSWDEMLFGTMSYRAATDEEKAARRAAATMGGED